MINIGSLLCWIILLSFGTLLFCMFGALYDGFSERTQDRLEIGVLCAMFVCCFSIALCCAYCFN